jgi:hypothetical protein
MVPNEFQYSETGEMFMGKKTEEELNQILENVRQIAESYAKPVPLAQDTESLRQADADADPNAQNTANPAQVFAQLFPNTQEGTETTQTVVRIFGGGVDGETAQPLIYPLSPSPENIEQITEAVNRLVPPEELQKMREAAVRMKENSGDMAEVMKELFNIAQASVSLKTNPAATQELLALQQTLEQRKKTKAQDVITAEGAAKPASVWRTVYIVAGVLIAVGLILTLTVPGFGDVVKGLFQ